MISCANCGTQNEMTTTSGYCYQCGRDLPPGDSAPVTAIAERPQDDLQRGEFQERASVSDPEFLKTQREGKLGTVAPLFLVAGLCLLFGLGGLVVLTCFSPPPISPDERQLHGALVFVAIWSAVIGAVFGVLAWWACYQPLVPATIGWVLLTAITAFGIMIRPDTIFKGGNIASYGLIIWLGYAVKLANDYERRKRAWQDDTVTRWKAEQKEKT
jgi:hypothetical protein